VFPSFFLNHICCKSFLASVRRRSSKPGLVFTRRLPHQLKREAKLLRGYFFLVFLVAFFFIVLLSLGLDFVVLAAALPGFLFTGIGTSSRVRSRTRRLRLPFASSPFGQKAGPGVPGCPGGFSDLASPASVSFEVSLAAACC